VLGLFHQISDQGGRAFYRHFLPLKRSTTRDIDESKIPSLLWLCQAHGGYGNASIAFTQITDVRASGIAAYSVCQISATDRNSQPTVTNWVNAYQESELVSLVAKGGDNPDVVAAQRALNILKYYHRPVGNGYLP